MGFFARSRAAVQVGGVVEFLLRSRPAVAARTVLSALAGRAAVAARTSMVARLLTRTRPAARVATSAAGAARQTVRSSLDVGGRLTGRAARARPAGNVVRVTYTLTSTVGAAAATNIGPDAWTNPGNAQGPVNGTTATRNGQALAATDAQLRLTYPTLTGKTALGITAVRLSYTVTQAGTALNNGGLELAYRIGTTGPWTVLETITANTTGARTHDITAAVAGDWARASTVEARVRVVLPGGTPLVACTADAVVRTVLATLVDPQ